MNHRYSKHARQRRAFTFVEMIIVVSVIGIATALALPMLGTTSATKLIAAADQLSADISVTQMESISHTDDLRYMVFDSANEAYYIAANSDQNTPITNAVGNKPYKVVFGKSSALSLAGVGIKSYSLGGDDRVRFGLYGELDQATPATITLEIDGLELTLTIDPVIAEVAIGNIVTTP